MTEIFKNITGYEGKYQISNQGRWKSLNYNRTGKEKITYGNKTKDNYRKVNLSKNGKAKSFGVHYLVAEAFIPVPDHLKHLVGKRYPSGLPMLQVNHKDEDTENNFVWLNEDGTVDPEKSNLEWCTVKENNNYGTHKEKISKTLSKILINREDLSKTVFQFDKQGNFIKEYPSLAEAQRETGIDRSSIAKCCKGIQKTAKGFLWKFKSEA